MNVSSTPDSACATVDISFVAPRYLAGGGDPAWITVPLHRACGWSYGHEPLLPQVLLSSPDQQAMLRLEPRLDEPWWSIRHASTADRPAWGASFDARVPVEIIAAFTDALTHPGPAQNNNLPEDPYKPLRQAGWHDEDGDVLVSPDGLARVEHFTDEGANCWFASAGTTAATDEPKWRAYFSDATPPRLITAFTTALADDSPLARPPHEVPVGRHLQITSEPVPVEDVGFALEWRVRELAARTVPASSTTSLPKMRPSGPGRAR